MTRATDIELALYRSRLLRKDANVNPHHFSKACRFVAKQAARIARHQLNACNGIERYDVKARQMLASWTEDDQAKADRETEESRKAIVDALSSFMTRGLKWDWKTDPRAGCVLRISDKRNVYDAFI